ncbi:kinase-like domain, phloem protein 2-like protein [Tanacetum coccineum]
MKFEKDESGRTAILPFHLYIMRTVSLTQAKIDMRKKIDLLKCIAASLLKNSSSFVIPTDEKQSDLLLNADDLDTMWVCLRDNCVIDDANGAEKIHSSPNRLAHLRIPLKDIESATNYFDEENVIEEDGFGKRYKGKLLWSGGSIDIIALRLTNKEWDDEKEQQFWMEISMLSSLKHKNIDSIAVFCNEVGAETIIYKHESMGRLDNYLSDPILLTWVKRLEICIGLAHAISYIHYDETRDFSVIHQNISSYTVRLNNDSEPKLSQFQHSMKIKASERDNSFHTDLVGSRKGYIDPTCLETNIGNHKSDIYSFGIILFELLCGRKSVSDDQDNKYLAKVAIFHYREKILDGIVDQDLWKQMNPRSLNIFAEIAYEKALELQLERENVVHLVAVAEVEGISSNHEKGSVTYVSSGSESHVTKKTTSFLNDVSYLKLSFQELKSATNNFDEENILDENGWIFKGRLLHSKQFIDIFGKAYVGNTKSIGHFQVVIVLARSLLYD